MSSPFSITQLPPVYFALVMATGIVSLAAQLFEFTLISKLLFCINIVAYAIICILFLARFIFYKKEFLADFLDSRKNMGFLSFVAATCILGSQFVLIAENIQVGIYLLVIGLSSWIILTYALFAIMIEKPQKPSLVAISGTWLLLIVATQAVAILSIQLEAYLPFFQKEVLFCSLILFLCGSMFYLIIITLIIYRLLFFTINAEDLSPSYWINMGAGAITVLAGDTLILDAEKWGFLTQLLPFLKGFTLLFWAIVTWWIPLMLILGVWRHVLKKVPVKYDSQYWGMVFPLGMYTVCTTKMSQAMKLPFLLGFADVFVKFAIGSWAIVFGYLLYSIVIKLINSFRIRHH